MTIHYLELADYLLIAEAILNTPAEELARLKRIGLADSALQAPAAGSADVEVYSDFATKTAVLVWHLVKNHPLPDGNKRVAFIAMVEFVERNGWEWLRSPDDPGETDGIIRSVADGSMSKTDLSSWVAGRIRKHRA